MQKILRDLGYVLTMLLSVIKTYDRHRIKLFVMSFFMMLQNLIFLFVWFVLFTTVPDIGGWQMHHMARMFGIVATSSGLFLFLAQGVRFLPNKIRTGDIDLFLTRPRHPLLSIAASASSPHSLGDILFGPFMWVVFGDVTWSDFWLLLFVSLMSCIIFSATIITAYSLSFWMKGNGALSDRLFETTFAASMNVLHIQPFAIKLVLYTVMPGCFIGLVPTELVTQFDPTLFATLCLAALAHSLLALATFNAGVRRYKRGI